MVYVYGFTLVELAVVAFAVGSSVVGLYIAYLAIGGIRRYENRSMWYLSVGLILLTGVTYTVAMVGTVLIRARILPLPTQDLFRLVVRMLQFAGLVFIAYSLYTRQ